jgi:Family of unknown function (DUF6406)
MTSDLPGTIEIYRSIPRRLGGGAFIAGDSYLDDQGRVDVRLMINDDAGERDTQCHEGDTFEFAGATWQVTKAFDPDLATRSHVATLSLIK